MEASELVVAVEAGRSVASALGLRADEAVVVHDSDRIALRLLPCDVLARVSPPDHRAGAEFEVEVARRLAGTDCPVAELEPRVEPRVHVRDGFSISLWTYYELLPSPVIAPADYADALTRLHAGLRQIVLNAPHFTDRVASAQSLVADPEQTPELSDRDRAILRNTLSEVTAAISDRSTSDQLLHGEPHPGNLLSTRKGPLFIDLETCCRGPVEFDIAHCLLPAGGDGRVATADEVCQHYPEAHRDVVAKCHILMWAMVTTWRWRRGDQLPNGRYWAVEGLNQLRAALDRYGLDLD
jgi:hypothetical protein